MSKHTEGPPRDKFVVGSPLGDNGINCWNGSCTYRKTEVERNTISRNAKHELWSWIQHQLHYSPCAQSYRHILRRKTVWLHFSQRKPGTDLQPTVWFPHSVLSKMTQARHVNRQSWHQCIVGSPVVTRICATTSINKNEVRSDEVTKYSWIEQYYDNGTFLCHSMIDMKSTDVTPQTMAMDQIEQVSKLMKCWPSYISLKHLPLHIHCQRNHNSNNCRVQSSLQH